MLVQGDGCDSLLSFHFTNNQGNEGKVEFPGGRGEMQAHIQPLRDVDVHLELIQVDPDQGFLDHVSLSASLR